MANSSRLNKNRNGQMFLPMNVEGGTWEEGFFNSTKVCVLIASAFINGGIALWASTLYIGWVALLLIYLLLVFVDQLVLRYIIFEEKYYSRMYQKMKMFEISTPSVFWAISSIKETEDGAVMVYSDAKIGVIVKVERDTITGKNEEFLETHYDAISDFYKEANIKQLKFVQMNIMEQAGKDPRLPKLDELVLKAPNKNIAKIVEAQIGHIKKITRATLFESDYWLFYSDDMNRSEALISDSIDCVYKLLDGAFVGFSILSGKELIELMKEEYGVKYFDYTEATVNMFRNSGLHIPKAFKIAGVRYESNEEAEIGNVENNRLNTLASYINRGVIKDGEWTIKDALSGKIRNTEKQNKQKIIGFNEVEALGKRDEQGEKAVINLDDDIFGEESDIIEYKESFIDDLLYPSDKSDDTSLSSLLSEFNEESSADKPKGKGLFGKKDKKKGIHDNIQLAKEDVSSGEINQQMEQQEVMIDELAVDDNDIIDF